MEEMIFEIPQLSIEEKKDDKEHIYLNNHPEFINPYLKVKDIKKLINNITGIDENRQKLELHFDFDSINDNDGCFWKKAFINIYDSSEYKYKIQKNNYEADIILNLNKNIGKLKQMISNITKIPIELQEFYLNDKILSDDKILKDENLFSDKLEIKIPEKHEFIKVKYPNSEIEEIKIDLCNTVYECLKQIKKEIFLKYAINYENKSLNSDDMLICFGIKKGDLIEISDKKCLGFAIQFLRGKETHLKLASTNTIKTVKYLIELSEGFKINSHSLIFKGKELKNNKTIEEYNIQNGDKVHDVYTIF